MKKFFTSLPALAVLFVCSCSSSNEEPDAPSSAKLSQTEYTLKTNESIQLKGSGLDNLKWESDNEFAATCENGVIRAEKVGTATIKYVGSRGGGLSFTVKVEPSHKLVDWPLTKWGSTESEIAKFEGRKPDNVSVEDDGIISLVYKNPSGLSGRRAYLMENGQLGSIWESYYVEEDRSVEFVNYLTDNFTESMYIDYMYQGLWISYTGTKKDPSVEFGIRTFYLRGSFNMVYYSPEGLEDMDKATHGY